MKKNIDKKEALNAGKQTFDEFKEFIAKGNVLDMAVGVIIGGAFGKIVTSVVNDLLMPLIGMIIGGIDFTNLSVKIGEANVTYGNFIQNVLDFLIIALCIFFIVKIVNKFTKKNEPAAEEVAPEEPKKDENTVLLEEIRDLLKEKQNV